MASLGKQWLDIKSSDAEVELRVADVDGRGGTEDAAAGNGFTGKATAMAQSGGTDCNLHVVEESGCRESEGNSCRWRWSKLRNGGDCLPCEV